MIVSAINRAITLILSLPKEPLYGAATPAAVPFIFAFASMVGHSSHLLPVSRRCYLVGCVPPPGGGDLSHHQEEPGGFLAKGILARGCGLMGGVGKMEASSVLQVSALMAFTQDLRP